MSNKEKTIFQYILPSQDGPLYSPNQNINHPHSKSSKNYYCNFIISWISPLLAPQRNYFSPSDASDVYHSEKCTAENFQIERNVMCNIVLKLSYQKECDRSDSILFDYEPKKFRLVHNQRKNGHHNHISFNLKLFRNLFPEWKSILEYPLKIIWLTDNVPVNICIYYFVLCDRFINETLTRG